MSCGVRSIEHGNLIDSVTARMVAAAGAFVVPTLATYDSLERHGKEAGAPDYLPDKLREVKDKGLEAIEICRAAGVKLGFGTDLLGGLHVYQRDEFRLRSEVETPFQILASATSVNAELLNIQASWAASLLGPARIYSRSREILCRTLACCMRNPTPSPEFGRVVCGWCEARQFNNLAKWSCCSQVSTLPNLRPTH